MKVRHRVGIIAAVAAALAFWFLIAVKSDYPWLIGLAPVLLAVWLLLVCYHGYFLLRASRWHRRQQEEKEAIAKLAIPPNIKKPNAFEGVKAIDDAQKRVLPNVPDRQGRFRAVAITVALAPPLALLFLSVQTLFFPHGGPWGVGLVIAEALFLFWVIWSVKINSDPTQHWIQERLRAELLRREQYLCLAAVGPYLTRGSALAEGAAKRLELIVNCDIDQLWQLIPLAAPYNSDDTAQGDHRWLDTLWQSAANLATLPDGLERMNCYLHYRIGKQKMWFTLGAQMNRHFEKSTARALKSAVLTAFAVVCIHAALLLVQVEHTGALPLLTHSLAFALPPLGASFMALQSLFAFRGLTFSYNYAHEELLRQEANLRRLIKRYQASSDDTAQHNGETEFQALVLHTEDSLTREMERWIFLNHRPEFDVTP